MFKAKEMIEALEGLFDLYEDWDYECDEEDYIEEVRDIDYVAVCNGIRANCSDVHEYTIDSVVGSCMTYRGKELFDQRACQVAVSEIDGSRGETALVRRYKELWLLEDMTFVVVSSVVFAACGEDDIYETNYRCVVGAVSENEDLFLTPEYLVEQLCELCVPEWEGDAIIYEM